MISEKHPSKEPTVNFIGKSPVAFRATGGITALFVSNFLPLPKSHIQRTPAVGEVDNFMLSFSHPFDVKLKSAMGSSISKTKDLEAFPHPTPDVVMVYFPVSIDLKLFKSNSSPVLEKPFGPFHVNVVACLLVAFNAKTPLLQTTIELLMGNDGFLGSDKKTEFMLKSEKYP